MKTPTSIKSCNPADYGFFYSMKNNNLPRFKHKMQRLKEIKFQGGKTF